MNGIISRGLMAALVLLIVSGMNASAQSTRQRAATLRDLLRSAAAPKTEVQPLERRTATQASARPPVRQVKHIGPQLSGSPIPQTATPLPPGIAVPAKKIPLPRTYHGRPVAGTREPDMGRRGDDPWDLARRLGIADNHSYPIPEDLRFVDLARQTEAQAYGKSDGCIHCHTDVGHMHPIDSVQIGCTDCHGGDATALDIKRAHVWPKFAPAFKDSANPVRSYTLLNHESPEFIRFMNPGDLRVAHIACGQCHANEVLQNRKSMMTHGCMLWGAALYNNGATDRKYSHVR